MTAHVTLPNPYKVKGYGIDGFTADQIELGKIYRFISDQGDVVERQVMGIDKPKDKVKLLRLTEGDTADVCMFTFVMVMRGRGIPEGKGDKE